MDLLRQKGGVVRVGQLEEKDGMAGGGRLRWCVLIAGAQEKTRERKTHKKEKYRFLYILQLAG